MQEVHDYNYRRLTTPKAHEEPRPHTPRPLLSDDWTNLENRFQQLHMTPEERDNMLLRLARLERALRVHGVPHPHPGGTDISTQRAELSGRYLDMGDFPRAFRQLHGAVNQDPAGAMLQNNIGAMYLEIGDLAQARDHLTRAIQQQEDLDTAYGNRGLVHIERGEYLEAYRDLSAAIRIAPDDPAHHNNMGVLFLESGFHETAVACFMSALQLDPGQPMFHSNLGFAHREMGDQEQASRLFRQADRIENEQFEAALQEDTG